jgi:hypothetical protein
MCAPRFSMLTTNSTHAPRSPRKTNLRGLRPDFMDDLQRRWITQRLVNDEASTDDEMRVDFEKDGISAADAAFYVGQRNAALLDGLHFALALPVTDGYQAGAILESSWGYEQTNIDFYRIEKRKGDWVWLIPLHSRNMENDTANMRGTSEPGEPYTAGEYVSCIGDWNGKPILRKLAIDRDGKIHGLSIKHGWAHLWDGKPSHWTAYA